MAGQMSTLVLDIPVAIAVALFLIAVLLRHGIKAFVAACIAASSFGAQFSLGVTLSIAKILPIIMIPAALRRGDTGLSLYVPFLFYAIGITLIASFLWTIPIGVSFFYGDARAFVQIFNFIMLALVARAIALALRERTTVERLWDFMTITVIIHGIASLYQLVAGFFNLPVIGISRPFGLTLESGVADFAAFGTSAGTTIIRPGGLAGEPKGMAVVFGIYIIAFLFCGRSLALRWRGFNLSKVSFALSILGFIAAFSTSAIIGMAAAMGFTTLLMGVGRQRLKLIYASFILLLCLALWMYLTGVSSLDELYGVVGERTTGRLGDELDIPIAASIDAMIRQPFIAIFGYGMGGSSFLVMEYLGEVFKYAYAPNVGAVFFIVELGIIGTGLLLYPLFSGNFRTGRFARKTGDVHVTLLTAISSSTFILSFAGSGIPFGYSLAIGSSVAAMSMCVQRDFNRTNEQLRCSLRGVKSEPGEIICRKRRGNRPEEIKITK